jgi:hypothetical protein
MEASQEITALLLARGDGDPAALEKLTPLIYDDLHKKARHYMSRENPGNLLQTTAPSANTSASSNLRSTNTGPTGTRRIWKS